MALSETLGSPARPAIDAVFNGRDMILSISVDTFNSKICGTYAAASRAAKNL